MQVKSCIAIMSIILISNLNLHSQKDYTSDVTSLDNIMETLYDVISGDKGVKRDWARFENLFIEEARLIPSSKNKEGEISYRIMSPKQYRERSGAFLEENGFFEKEIKRTVEEYGSLVHIWSTYECFRTSKDTIPFMRGINSIQLMNDGDRWWVMQIYWLGESEDNPLPKQYLPKK